VTAALSS